jgi:tetratricopeptide (TPR) repeat protein
LAQLWHHPMRHFIVLMILYATALSAQTFDDLLGKGDQFYVAQNYQEAIKYFSQAIALNAKQVKGYWYRADAYRQLLKYQEAAADYTKALELEPNNVKFLTRRGDCYYSTNQFQLAVNDYTRGLALDRANAKLWLYRGDSYAKLGDTNNACDDYQQAYELGDKGAKVQARQVRCDWVTALAKPCPSGEALINRVEIEPFTGAIIIGRGLSFEAFEAVTVKDEKTITGPEYAMNQEFDFKITKPRNFCQDDEASVYFGIGIKLKDGEKELVSVANIYEGQEQGVIEESIKYLSSKIDFSTPMELGKNYHLNIRFFDTRGHGEVAVSVPVKLATATKTSTSIFRSQSSLGAGVTSAAVGFEPAKLEVRAKGRRELLRTFTFYRNLAYTATITTKNPLPKSVSLTQQLYTAKGEPVPSRTGKLTINQQQATIEFNTIGLKPGSYKLWMRVGDTDSSNCLALVMPMVVR